MRRLNGGGQGHPGYRDRLDPNGEIGQLARGLALVAGPPFRWVFGLLGVRPEIFKQAKAARQDYDRVTSAPDRIAPVLGPLGWIVFGDAALGDYEEAARLAVDGKSDEAEELLTEKWNEPAMLLRVVQRVRLPYYGDEKTEQIGHHRSRLIRKALDLHEAGHYEGSIPIVLTQIDGLFIDVTGKPAELFFRKKNHLLVDNETLAGHPAGLQVLATLMSKHVSRTAAMGELTRHGILHGRELSYDTRRNSTKAFVALLSVLEWASPRLKAQSDEAMARRQARYAGSKERDQHGRMLDRRGFNEAQVLLNRVSAFQTGYFKRHGRYAPEQETRDPGGFLLDRGEFELCVSAQGHEYWAWAGTPPGVYIGIAGRDGEGVGWRYQGEVPPLGGSGSGADWRHEIHDSPHPEW